MDITLRPISNLLSPKLLKIYLLILGFILALWLVQFVPVWVDYPQFRDSARAMVNGSNPYAQALGFYNAPWLIPLMIPFALQDDATGNGLLFVIGFAAFGYLAYRIRAKFTGTLLLLSSPAIIANQTLPNIDWLPLLGLFVKPSIGLLLLAIKPQVGLGAMIVIALVSLKQKTFVKTFTPLILMTWLSMEVYGFWFVRSSNLTNMGWNTSLFPYSLLIGIPLLIYAMRQSNKLNAIASTILCSPYISAPSWSGLFLALARYPKVMLISSLGFWAWRIWASQS